LGKERARGGKGDGKEATGQWMWVLRAPGDAIGLKEGGQKGTVHKKYTVLEICLHRGKRKRRVRKEISVPTYRVFGLNCEGLNEIRGERKSYRARVKGGNQKPLAREKAERIGVKVAKGRGEKTLRNMD